MNTRLWVVVSLVFVLASPPLRAAPAQLQAVRWSAGPRPSLRLDFSAPPSYRIRSSGSQLVIEVSGTTLATALPPPASAHPVAAGLVAVPDKGGLRLQVALKRPAEHRLHVEPLKAGARLVIAWTVPRGADARAPSPGAAQPAPQAGGARQAARGARAKPDPFIVAIDAGHGGKDTGAIGPGGIREKNVVLAIARRLAGFISAEPGMRAIMVRKGDEFVDLRHRAAAARRAHADLFVSLHADACADGDVKGSSVYTLSEHGATSEAARWLADRENAALLGNVKLNGKDRVLASVLLDLSKNATLEASEKAADRVLRELKKEFPVHHPEVQKAGFVVLKSLDMPSLLVETAFISNPTEERNLAHPGHQARLARALFNGIRAYAAETQRALPPGVRVAEAP
ncbi:N-acetylmuramoyl-L-alanine amidase [Candidatus Methylocalor cossyra]|uniref:N-acetylmuramoyl-L-alanine amidase n=1 Tax=Candidatus Methylocalor cossyra TaxID=3108543 RepID=A0ABM9NFG0_9GAMM